MLKSALIIAVSFLFIACDNTETKRDEVSPFAGTWVNDGLLKNTGDLCQLIEDMKDMTSYEKLQVTGYKVGLIGAVTAMDLESKILFEKTPIWVINSQGATTESKINKSQKGCVGCEDINSQKMALSEKGTLTVSWDLESKSDDDIFEYSRLNVIQAEALVAKAQNCIACSDSINKPCDSDDLAKFLGQDK